MNTLKKYTVGFALSAVFTLVAFGAVSFQLLPIGLLATALVCLAVAQLLVQLFFFLHVGIKGDSSWGLVALLFAVVVTVIIIGGTLWIMRNVEHNQSMPAMSPMDEDKMFSPQTLDD